MKYLLLGSLLIACGGTNHFTSIKTPNGKNGAALMCSNTTSCYKYSGEACPTGYRVIQQLPPADGSQRTTLIIECNED